MTFEILTGYRPFELHAGEGMTKLYEEILNVSRDLPDEHSVEARHFASILMQKDPTQRLGTGNNGGDHVRKHPFFQWHQLGGFVSQKNKYAMQTE
jgi:serum/glucocorticoid-regulated kinase 2